MNARPDPEQHSDQDATAAAACERASAACARTAERLAAADIVAEELAEYIPEHRKLLIRRPPTMRALGRVWRLGPLLLGANGQLYALGKATRAAERGRPGYQSLSREERKEIAAAALRGGYELGTAVNYDAMPLQLDPASLAQVDTSAPVGLADDEVRVRWRAGASLAGAVTLDAFLTERADLLIDPPFAD